MDTHLSAWSAARGATPAARPGLAPVASFGDVEAEYRALREGAGLWDRGAWGAWRLAGKEPHLFLNKYCTQDLRGLTPGAGAYGCVLSLKGGLVADVWALRRADDVVCLVAPAARAALPEHLRRYAMLDRVTTTDLAATHALLGLTGPRAPEVAAAVVGAPLPAAPLAHVTQGDLLAARDDLGDVPGAALLAPAERAAALADALVAAGARPVGADALDRVRVEAGVPLLGVDLDEKTLPLEAGLEARGVSMTKGCYLGQEVIARVSHRGHVNRHLTWLAVDGPPPATPAPLLRDGQPAGTLTSCVVSPRRGGASLGLALLHRKHGDPGTALSLGAATATVIGPAGS